jgi:hypothetical protein
MQARPSPGKTRNSNRETHEIREQKQKTKSEGEEPLTGGSEVLREQALKVIGAG